MPRIIFLFVIVLCFPKHALSLAPPLEREVTLSFNNEKITGVLSKIQDQTGLIFSYQPSVINDVGPITKQFKQKTVREVLSSIFPKTVMFKAKSNYIILKEKPIEKNPSKAELSGYVYDKATEKKLPNVTIYDKTTLQAVTTNEYGYYSITLPKDNQCLSVNKENYRDTCIAIDQLNNSAITNISIDSKNDSLKMRDSLYWQNRIKDFSKATNDLFRRFKGYINTLNIKDTLARQVQISFLPFLGTNGVLSGNVYNKYSLNVIGGYSRGTNGMELASIFNINREKTKGVQLAGAFNLVGDTASGIQMAGLFNMNGSYVTGWQAAGAFNMNFGNTKAVQSAGLFNLNTGKTDGIQLAGAFNLNAGELNGISAAGLFNVNRYSLRGIQLAGFMNVTGDTLKGLSAAGYLNLTWYSKKSTEVAGAFNLTNYGEENVQIAGLFNNTRHGSSRLQIAGLFNKTKTLTGLQIALFNVADSASGVPIGLLSIVKNGLHQFELSSDELFYTNIAMRLGVKQFYNVFNFGCQPMANELMWSIGYGIGTSFQLNNRLILDVNASSNHVNVGGFYFATSELYKLYVGFEFKVAKKMALAIGPTYNVYWTDALLPRYSQQYSNIAPYYINNTITPNDFNLKSWFGVKAALRIF